MRGTPTQTWLDIPSYDNSDILATLIPLSVVELLSYKFFALPFTKTVLPWTP